jgi:hypothetical protein
MAKKPPKAPPPSDDFDPERDLGDEIAPIEEVSEDDFLADVVADDGDEATKLTKGDAKDHVLPEVEVEADAVEADEIVAEDAEAVADDLFAGVTTAEDDAATKSMPGAKDAAADDEEVAASALMEDDEASPHEAATMGEMAVVEEDDPFADVGAKGEVIDEGALVGAGVGGPGEPEEPAYEEEVPKPALHWLTWTLIGLNVVAALAAAVLLLMDYEKRQQYSYANFRLDLLMLGLPNEREEEALTAARVTLPTFRHSPEELKRTAASRPGALAVGDKFEAVEEPYFRRIPPSMLTKEILSEHFTGNGEPVATVEAEIKRVEKIVVDDIKRAAEESYAALKSDADKRTQITALLHPLAMDAKQSEALDARIKSAQGPELEKLYMEAAQRRMAFDFLLPLELFRPGDDSKGLFVEKFGDLEALPLEKVLDRVTQRIKSTIGDNYEPAIHLGEEWGNIKRDTIEKRLTIAFTLLSLAHVKKPDGKAELYPELLERIPLVVGQYDFALACELFPSRILAINDIVLDRIKIDREGFEESSKGAIVRGKAFIDYYEAELQRIRFLQDDIFKAKKRLTELQAQKASCEAHLKDRIQKRDETLAQIAVARVKTNKDAAELKVFQDDLFRYQTELATSEDELERIHRQIRDRLSSIKTGGKKP